MKSGLFFKIIKKIKLLIRGQYLIVKSGPVSYRIGQILLSNYKVLYVRDTKMDLDNNEIAFLLQYLKKCYAIEEEKQVEAYLND